LEIMAQTLGYDMDAFGREALKAEKEIQISSMRTVFAESEVTSLLAKGENRLSTGVHTPASIAWLSA
jgi:(R)-2-hydroxyacyl-CoA dehydratese activating ATPase